MAGKISSRLHPHTQLNPQLTNIIARVKNKKQSGSASGSSVHMSDYFVYDMSVRRWEEVIMRGG
jgi:hypothetical protein